jgi:hypothetical protein
MSIHLSQVVSGRRPGGIHGLLALALTSGCALVAADTAPAPKEDGTAKPDKAEGEAGAVDLHNWMTLSVGGTFVNGDTAAFQHQYGLPKGAFGGVQDFHFEQETGTNTMLKVDGHGIFDNHDYSIRLDLTKQDVGFVRAGYTQFRTYYDGNGGYFPGAPWFQLYNNDLTVDRSEAWIEAGLRLPKWPEITLRYAHETREGSKDSTSWGLTTQTGGAGARSIVPSFWGLDEVRDILALDARKTFGKTDVGVGLRFESASNNDSLNLRYLPGQSTSPDLLLPPDSYVTQKEGLDSQMFNVHAFTESRLGRKALFTVGYAFTTMDTDLSGYRVYGTQYDPDMAQRLPSLNTFQGLSGGSELQQQVANVNLMLTLEDSLFLVPSVRIEKQDVQSVSSYDLIAAPLSSYAQDLSSDRGLLDVSEALELRYTGVTNWVFYARGGWLQGSGDLNENWANLSTAANVLFRSTDDSRSSQKYTAGASWYPLRRLQLSAEYYHKLRTTDYDNTQDSTPNAPPSPNRYPAYLVAQDTKTDDVNARVSWRPRNNLNFVARYDFQLSTIDTRADDLSSVQSAEITSQIFSGTASWTPVNRLYLQGSFSYVLDTTDTPAADITGAVQNAQNDYWTVTFGAGYALDNKTDLNVQYSHYRADNYVNNAAVGMPYGAGFENNAISATLTRRLSNRVTVSLKYGFYASTDETSGGHDDYDAQVVSTSLQYRF